MDFPNYEYRHYSHHLAAAFLSASSSFDKGSSLYFVCYSGCDSCVWAALAGVELQTDEVAQDGPSCVYHFREHSKKFHDLICPHICVCC